MRLVFRGGYEGAGVLGKELEMSDRRGWRSSDGRQFAATTVTASTMAGHGAHLAHPLLAPF